MRCLEISFVIFVAFTVKVGRCLPLPDHPGLVLKSEIVDTSEAKALYRDHYKFMQRAGVCSAPKERVISMQSIHPQPHKRYIPECTLLHRCSSETGCCSDTGKICTAVERQEVVQYFQVFSLSENGNHHVHLEAVTLVNHTRCGCEDGINVPR